MRAQERKDLPVSTVRVFNYSERRLYGRSLKKGKPKGNGKKGKRSRPGFRPRSKGKGYAAWENDRQDTAFCGKGKGKKGKKGMKGKDSFKGMPSWKGKKDKATEGTREENHFNNNLHKQTSPNKQHLAHRKPPKNRICPGRRKLELWL